MVYGEHESKERVWRGVFVLGGGVVGRGFGIGELVVVTTGWRGWLRVEREEVLGFAEGITLEEALRHREARERALEGKGWRCVSELGEFVFK